MFLAGEDDNLMELPISTIGEGITYLMAAYYVFGEEYLSQYKPLLYFFKDMIMDKADNSKRPTRYASFVSTMARYKLVQCTKRSIVWNSHVRYDIVYCIVCIQLCCQKHIESVDSISRDGPDTPIYVIHYIKPKISEQVKFNFDIHNQQQNIYSRPRTFIYTIVHVRTSYLKNSQLSFFFLLLTLDCLDLSA